MAATLSIWHCLARSRARPYQQKVEPCRSLIFNHIFSPPQMASKSTLFVARTLSSQSAVIAHVRDCPGLKGTMLNGTVCWSSLFSKGLSLSLSLFYCHLSVFQGKGGLSPFPLSLFPQAAICCRCIKCFVFDNLYEQLMKYYYYCSYIPYYNIVPSIGCI